MNSTTDNFDKLIDQVQTTRKRTIEVIDTYYSELENLTEDISSCSSSSVLWGYRDRLEEMRAGTYKLIKSTTRNLGSAKEAYNDGMRNAMSRMKSTGGLHFSEREASYETKNIGSYKILTNLERSLSDLSNFSRYLDGRLQWIKDRQRWLLEKEKGL